MGKREGAVEGLDIESEWAGRRVLVTGHTGFKGAWLTSWLSELGAIVFGYARPPETTPNLFELAGIERLANSTYGDINDGAKLAGCLEESQAEVVFHLAAQSLVRQSYDDPVGTFATNVGGTVTLLQAVRHSPWVRAVVVVTSDKCYANNEWVWGYREIDPLGGRDPYSGSKGCTEIAARAMQMSFFRPFVPSGHPARIATVRAGNVIGGGDWSRDRLIPDIIRGCLGTSGEIRLRNPRAVRPWQHVLEPLAAYLRIAVLLRRETEGVDQAWNIGPEMCDAREVQEVATTLAARLGTGRVVSAPDEAAVHEANLLMLDCAKAKAMLGWRPVLSFEDCIALTADWYGGWHKGCNMESVTRAQIADFRLRMRTAAESRRNGMSA